MIISLIAALGVLGSASGGRELTEVTLIQTLGVDGDGDLELTAVGEDEGETEAERYRVRGGSLAQAREELKALGDTRLEVTHVAQLVLGPDVPVEEILWQELTNRESGCGATVWLTRDESAGALLEGAGHPCKRLRSLEENASVAAPTLLEAISALTREGEVTLPVLTRRGDELAVAGTRTIKEG